MTCRCCQDWAWTCTALLLHRRTGRTPPSVHASHADFMSVVGLAMRRRMRGPANTAAGGMRRNTPRGYSGVPRVRPVDRIATLSHSRIGVGSRRLENPAGCASAFAANDERRHGRGGRPSVRCRGRRREVARPSAPAVGFVGQSAGPLVGSSAVGSSAGAPLGPSADAAVGEIFITQASVRPLLAPPSEPRVYPVR